MRHLQGCKDFECPEGYIKCPKAHCIPVHYLFNDKLDCPIGEDESLLICKPNFLEGYFNSSIQESVFLHPDRICDGSTDCLEGTDEMGCRVTCAEQFLRAVGFVIADNYDRFEQLTNVSFIDSRTRMIDFSHINASLVMSAICDLNHLKGYPRFQNTNVVLRSHLGGSSFVTVDGPPASLLQQCSLSGSAASSREEGRLAVFCGRFHRFQLSPLSAHRRGTVGDLQSCVSNSPQSPNIQRVWP